MINSASFPRRKNTTKCFSFKTVSKNDVSFTFKKKLKNHKLYFNQILLFLCKLAKSSMSFSKSTLKSRSTAKTHKSLNLISDIVLRVFVLISFILLNVLPHVVDETGNVDYLCSFCMETVLVDLVVILKND